MAWDFTSELMSGQATIGYGIDAILTTPLLGLGGLNDEELQTVATIGFGSHGFRNLTVDEVRTLAAITRMEEFRREDRFL